MILYDYQGYWRDDARAKTRIAAEQFPFRIIAIKRPSRKKGAGWVFEEI